ncbi:MAG: hypothetical protein R3Y11_01870 [Pseudomonadota bacterium]
MRSDKKVSKAQWEKARVDYEIHGVSMYKIAKGFGVSTGLVSNRAKKEEWGNKGGLKNLVENRVEAAKVLVESNKAIEDLPMLLRENVESATRERLDNELLLLSFDRALMLKGKDLLEVTDSVSEWELLTRGRRNLAPTKGAEQTINVNQNAQAGVVNPLSPSEALADLLERDANG